MAVYVGVAAVVAAVFAVLGRHLGIVGDGIEEALVFRKKWFWIVVVLVVIGGGAAAAFARRGDTGITVTVETIQKRDLEAIVSASGKIDPKKTVNISAQTMGRVTHLAVKEGDRVKRRPVPAADRSGQRRSRGAARRRRGGRRAHGARAVARRPAERARQSRRGAPEPQAPDRNLAAAGLTTRESLERAQAEVEVRESDLKAREQEIKNRETQLNQQEAGLSSSQHTLTQVRFESPFDGIVTRRNIEEGENVMVGTMNNAGTVLLTVADMSVIEAEVEVDETDIPFVQLGQPAKIMIDAIAGQDVHGHGHRDRQQPDPGRRRAARRARRRTSRSRSRSTARFRRCVPASPARPRSRRRRSKQAVSVPIQAMTVRELLYDAQGNVVHEPRPPRRGFRFGPPQPAPVAAAPTRAQAGPKARREWKACS